MRNRQSTETVNLASLSEMGTINIGRSVASTLYRKNTTIWLSGELGSGKTVFAKGLGLGLGIKNAITSPTFAIENRYGDKFLHVDLYRLDEKEAERIMEENAEFPGIQIIEWSERVVWKDGIHISLKEISQTERNVKITFTDVPLPSRRQIEKWRREINLPPHIAAHCDAVGLFAEKCGYALLKRGVATRPLALKRAGEMHDALKLVDAVGGRRCPQPPEAIMGKYRCSHEEACARFLRERGYEELARVVETHGLRAIDASGAMETTEQKILFYADKRVLGSRAVALDERFDDFVRRYGNGMESENAGRWRRKTKELEKELFFPAQN